MAGKCFESLIDTDRLLGVPQPKKYDFELAGHKGIA